MTEETRKRLIAEAAAAIAAAFPHELTDLMMREAIHAMLNRLLRGEQDLFMEVVRDAVVTALRAKTREILDTTMKARIAELASSISVSAIESIERIKR